MKHMLLGFLLISLIAVFPAHAQEFQTGEVEFNGGKYPAYFKEVDASEELATNAIVELMESKGFKGKTYKGFIIYRNIGIPGQVAGEPQDVFFKVEPVGKKSNNRTKISIVITRPGQITEDKVAKDMRGKSQGVVLAAGGAEIFTSLAPSLDNQVYLKNIADQEGEVKKAEKRLADLRDELSKMEKQLQKLKENIENTKVDITNQEKTLESARKELETRKAAKPASASGL